LIPTQFHTQIKVVVHAQRRWTRKASDMAGTPPCAARARRGAPERPHIREL